LDKRGNDSSHKQHKDNQYQFWQENKNTCPHLLHGFHYGRLPVHAKAPFVQKKVCGSTRDAKCFPC
jgi:hypothetical protein